MSGLLTLALTPQGRAAGALLAAVLLFGGGYIKGRVDGRAIQRAETTDASYQAIKRRVDLNVKIDRMGDADLCRAIGGELRDGACQ